MTAQELPGREAWQDWARREFAAQPEKIEGAVDAAVEVLQRGSSPQVAVVAARLQAGPVPVVEVRALGDEIQMMERVVADLAAVQPGGDLTQTALDHLKGVYLRRLDEARGLHQRAVESLGHARAAAAGLPADALRIPPAVPGPPGPSLREFFADNSILIISVAGAFLLIVATLLFEIYGTTGFGDAVRFVGVLVLNLLFGAAAMICLARSKLRLVGQTYLAIFALMVPLTMAAAWVFLSLESRGISRDLALGTGGLGCSVLYAILAARLGSRGYAVLSLLALPIGTYGVLAAAGAGLWIGPWLTALVFVYVQIAYPPRGAPAGLRLFTGLAEPFIHGAVLVSLAWSLGQAASEWNAEIVSQSRPSFQLPTALGLITIAYTIYCLRAHRGWMAWAAWGALTATVLTTVEPLGWGVRGYVVDLVILAWVYAAGAHWTAGRGTQMIVRVGAVIQAAVPAALAASPDGLQAGALLAAAGAGVFVAVDARQPAWLAAPAGIFAVDWYWLAKSLLPPPPEATADTLILTYSPLPVVFGLAALVLRQTVRRWAWPLYAVGGLIGAGVAAAATGQGDLTLAGRALLVYAVVTYVAAALERWWPGLIAALIAAATGGLLLLAAASVAPAWYPVTMTAIGVVMYFGHRAWRVPNLARVHRFTALAIVGLTAASSFAVPAFWVKGSAGSMSALLSLLATAGLLLVDGRRHRFPILEYGAAAVTSLGGFWCARFIGIDNIQSDVALPGPVLVVLGVLAAQDRRRPAPLAACRAAVAVGAAALMGVSALQSVTEFAAGTYTSLWVVEAVAALLAGIGARSRTLVLAGGAGLALGALRAIFLILESVQVYVVFGVIAILLLIAAGVLAAARDRLAGARTAVAHSWSEWT